MDPPPRSPVLLPLTRHELDDGSAFFSGSLPESLTWSADQFAVIWAIHPTTKHRIWMHGKQVEIPRWQQAFGQDYHFSGQTFAAPPVPEMLRPLLEGLRSLVDDRLNGLLLNWYDGPGHYIGPHHDSRRNLVPDSPIVTVSFGETRRFRLTRVCGSRKSSVDFPAPHGTVFVMPDATNQAWKHSVPKSTRYTGRRISVTLRAFGPPSGG